MYLVKCLNWNVKYNWQIYQVVIKIKFTSQKIDKLIQTCWQNYGNLNKKLRN